MEGDVNTADRIAAALRPIAPEGQLSTADVPLIDRIAASWDLRSPMPNPAPTPVAALPTFPAETIAITPRAAAETAGHEAIVREWYRDSKGIGTWGIGVTNASGHKVDRYKDNPQTIEHVLAIYIWLLRENYAPAVRKAFAGHALTEAQFAAALSFQYNTGKILVASWPTLWKAGQIEAAERSFMEWRNPPEIVERRQKECDLFFDGIWSGDGTVRVLGVRKPSYQPDFRSRERIDALPIFERLLA